MIDKFRLVAALLVIAIHTAPFASVDESLDYVLTYGVGRIAVPFFLMTSGYFVLGPYLKSGFRENKKYLQYLKKIGLLYGGCILLYAPLMWYAKKLPGNLFEGVKMLVFDGTFYHLWYFPALLLGSVLTVGLLQCSSKRWSIGIAFSLYLFGLLGDSYYRISTDIPPLSAVYDVLFLFSSYTRNGIFYAPLFLMMGALLWKKKICPSPVGYLVALALLMVESFLTYYFGLQRHNSMYLMLPVVMYFFYPLLLRGRQQAPRWLRRGTSFLYVIHPIAIILVRGMAGLMGMERLLVDQSLVHYIAVCAVSFCLMGYELYILQLVKRFTRRKSDV